ncbi:cation diffusion facilitator family transporter [Sulfitobacter aestuarii]|uniref:Cation diffusion facilitator family transporter n=1 Tax=Sulfitobacter aestuarii TaxID=2161676 RepID=A0ABW5U6A5_9RHOB
MAQGHHHHHHVDPESGDLKVALAVAINLALTLAQIIGGIVAGSLSLIADALHNLSDAIALIIAFAARKIARRPADTRMTFGYGRIEAVAALINYTTLIVIGLYLVYEAIWRFFEPSPVTGWIIVVVAGIALLIDLATAALTYSMSKSSVNIRAAFLHNLADALGSVAVIVAGSLVIWFGWHWVDPAATLLIAGYILWQSALEMPVVVRILMLGSPPEIDAEAVIATMLEVEGVGSVHHVHLWMMGEHENALNAHLVLESQASGSAGAVKKRLARQYHLHHSTLEIENAAERCRDAQVIGH